jgi:hypothetical protein
MAMTQSSPIQVSPARLWAMRVMYLLIAIGAGLMVWPLIVSHPPTTPRMTGVAWTLLGTMSLLSLLGLRHPLQMIPILLFELAWKMIWLAAFALPRWLEGSLDAAMRTSMFETSLGLVLLVVIPWRYVWAHYVARPADNWTIARAADPVRQSS